MTTTTTLTTHQLAELLRKTAPHIGRHSGYSAINGLRLDSDGNQLHAIATDRYTLAVARARLSNTAPAWALTISTRDLPALTAWLDADEGEENVHLSPGTDGVTITSDRRKLVLPAYSGEFPDWRGMIRTALETEATESPFSGFQSDYMGRWTSAGREVCTWQAAFDKPVVVYSHQFVGLLMPRRIGDEESPAARYEEWSDSLGKGDKVEQADTLHPYEPQELAERENYVDDAAADLLKQVLRSTSDMFELSTSDPGALAAYALAGCRAWIAYRLLKAMKKADPKLLRETLADTDEQLESGEIGEWAWDEAEKAGHDPQKWHDDYEAHLKKLADKRQTQEQAERWERVAMAFNAATQAGVKFRIEPNPHVQWDSDNNRWVATDASAA
ncbi:DNA polymerase III subunit beta family protein [Streptomyces sp. LZ34]